MPILPLVVERYLRAYNEKNMDDLVMCVTDDVIFENVSNREGVIRVEGKGAFRGIATMSARVFRQRSQMIRFAVVSTDSVALEIDFEAEVAADMENGWRAGQTVNLRGATFIKLRDGLISNLVDIS